MSLVVACCLAPVGQAAAATPSAEAPSPPTSTGEDASIDFTRGRKQTPWIRRWRPEPHLVAVDLFGGVFLADPEHDLYDPRTAPQEPLWAVAPDVGLRAGYFPLRVLGVEAEFSAVPTRLRSITNDFAFVYGFRGHAVLQLPFYSVVPFFLVGYGLLGVRSHILILGDDVDPAFHYGGGVKVYVNRWVGLRVEARSIVSAAEARQDSGVGHVQVLGGVTFTFNRKPPPKRPPEPPYVDPDRDRDGFPNERDACPDVTGVAPDGCPDRDGDGFRDDLDLCPDEPGIAPAGCPDKDTDGDGIMDSADQCDDEREVYNGFEDLDGCPDERPAEIEEFDGIIPGIEFDFEKATIRPSSQPVLDRAVEILEKYGLRVRITGHTDDVGTPEFNEELSRQRAEAVKAYLVEAGVDPSRIEIEGRGATEPLAPNDSEANRAKNRRIEFKVLSQGPSEP